MGTNLFGIVAISCLVVPLAALAQNATLITTFTKPTPALGDWLGHSVAAVESDRVLIGAPYEDTGASRAGAAYLFSTSGMLLTTFTNPAPAGFDVFGISVAAVGSERVLIGASGDDTGVTNSGVAYLFGTNGTLLTIFTNPTPALDDSFGSSVAAVGSDRVLIGAYADNTGAFDAGAAYLFRTDGTLLTSFTNPAPAVGDHFGIAVAAVGSDRVLIGAYLDGTGAFQAGAAYLFRTNGTLLTTFTNPAPANSGLFGYSVAAVGSDRVLIGAYWDDTGTVDAGAAYLFRTDGTLLTTFTNPTPAINDSFGYSVVAVGSDRVLIAAYLDDTGATDTGAAYLFSLLPPAAPSISIRLTTTNTLAISWSSPSAGFTLQQNTGGIETVNWSNVTDTIQDDGTNRTLIINPPSGNRFYRLFQP